MIVREAMDAVNNPFQSKSRRAAFIDQHMQFNELADHYIRSADALVSMALDNDSLLDVHVQPVCFLYRHGLELLIKDLAWKAHYLATGIKIYQQSDWREYGKHRIYQLWILAKADARRVLESDFPHDNEVIKQADKVIRQFERYDPASMSFRYPFEKKIRPSSAKATHVDLTELRENVHKTAGYLSEIFNRVEYYMTEEQ